MKSKKITKVIYYLFSFFGLLLFIGYYMQGLGADEPFTVSLIKHSYSQIIHLDFFDVHPPLYYLLLKAFLDITTFWTKSMIIKIAFARILSLAFFFISFYFLLLTLSILKLKVNRVMLLIFFFVFPQISNYSLSLRMYQLAAMLIVLEIYGLLTFNHNKLWGLMITIISVGLSFYINYFTTMFAGAILLVELFSYLIKRMYKKSLYILCSGILDLVLFIPGYFFLYHQLIYVSSYHYSNYVGAKPPFGHNIYFQILSVFTGKPVGSLPSIITCIILLFIGIVSTMMIRKYNKSTYKIICKLYISIIIGLLPAMLLSFIKHPMIIGRYGHPVFFTLYLFIVASILDIIKHSNESLYLKLFIIISCLLLFMMDIKNVKDLISYDKIDYNYIFTYIQFNNNSHKTIYLDGFRAVYCSTYLSNKNKKVVSKSLPIKSTLASNNTKLMLNVFSNIRYRN